MRWRRVLGWCIALACLPRLDAADPPTLQEWHPCDMATTVSGVQAECATVTMPLCHGDVCSDSENRTVELFVKRIAATGTTSTRNVWFVPDQAFATPVQAVELQMVLLYQQLQGDVSVYLMDQRGTGHSTLFDCAASQATSTSSDQGVLVAPSEVANCADALHTTFGEHFAEAFSLTSAARDIVTFISLFQAHTKVFLYGVGSGTLVIERAMHFPSEEIIGFVFDSTATTSGGKKKEFPYRSRSDKDFGAVAKGFLTLCDNDSECSKRFNGEKLETVLQGVLDSIDKPSTACFPVTNALQNANGSQGFVDEPPSFALRRLLATMLEEPVLRPFIPVVIRRLQRCNDNDIDVLIGFITRLQVYLTAKFQLIETSAGAGAARLVFDLIEFSEMWEDPPPSQSELLARFTKTQISHGVPYSELKRYCAFTGDSTTACRAFSSNSSTSKLRYSRDGNWNVPAKIKDQSSVLFLASRFDGNAPLSYAQTLLDALQGDSKQLLVFDAATHNVLFNTPSVPTNESQAAIPSCSRSVLASFIENDGDFSSLDTSCMAELPTNVSLAITAASSVDVLGVADPYDGVLPHEAKSSSGSGSHITVTPAASIPPPTSSVDTRGLQTSRNRYRTAFIVVLVFAFVLLILVVILLYRARKKRLLEEEELQLRQMRGEEVDDMAFLRDLYNPSPSEWFNYRSNRMHL